MFSEVVSYCNAPQGLWDSAPGASGEESHAIWRFIFLHRHFLNCWLWRCNAQNLAVSVTGGHHDLCGAGGAAAAGVRY